MNIQDELITFAEAARRLPRRPSPSTFWRWRKKGIRGVKLQCVRVGGAWATTMRALEDFINRQTEAMESNSNDEPKNTPAHRPMEQLIAAGLIATNTLESPSRGKRQADN